MSRVRDMHLSGILAPYLSQQAKEGRTAEAVATSLD